MAERLGEALLDLRTDDKGFDRGVDNAERKAQGLGRRLDDTAKRAAAMGKALALAATASATAMGLMVKRAIDNADAMSKNAARVGVSTEALSRLAWAGDLSDVSIGALTGSMARLSNVMGQVASGQGKDTKAIFDALGISVTEADGRLRSIDAVMMDVADVFASMENGADKTAIAIKLFGRSGAELIPLLNNGKAGLAEMGAEADRLGITISTDMGKRAEAFNDAMTRVKAAFQGVIIQLTEQLLPYLNEWGDKLNDPETVAAAQRMASGVVGAMEQMVGGIKSAVEWLTWLAEGWERLSNLPGLVDGYNLFGQPIGGEGDASGNTRGIDDEDFENRTNPPLPGKTDRLPRKPRETRTFDFGNLNTGTDAETKALEAKRQAVTDLIAQLETELATLRETDPVQREMIALRQTLAAATPEQTEAIRNLIAEQQKEREELRANEEAMRSNLEVLDNFVTTFMSGIEQGKNFWQALGDAAVSSIGRIADKLWNDLLSALMEIEKVGGGGFLGGIGGFFKSIFAGFRANGGLIPNGTFGIVGERGPEPVIGTSRGAMVLPNSTLATMGGQGGNSETTVRLLMPEGWRAEIVGEAVGKAGDNTVKIVQGFQKGRENQWQNGGDFV